jgi:hypothetical protein
MSKTEAKLNKLEKERIFKPNTTQETGAVRRLVNKIWKALDALPRETQLAIEAYYQNGEALSGDQADQWKACSGDQLASELRELVGKDKFLEYMQVAEPGVIRFLMDTGPDYKGPENITIPPPNYNKEYQK